MKRIVLGALGLLLAALIFAPTSSAARLPLAAPRLTAFAGAPACTTQKITAVWSGMNGNNGKATGLTITVLGPCVGLPYELTVDDNGVRQTFKSTTTTAPMSFALNPAVTLKNGVAGIAILINNRAIPIG
ncbi:MAG: hypothetical protein QOH55_967 [Microbacteriaceae bacterium]|jgi:hypothetical protein|nr:hypothetical protein [Microbacteriaceae bacterium]